MRNFEKNSIVPGVLVHFKVLNDNPFLKETMEVTKFEGYVMMVSREKATEKSIISFELRISHEYLLCTNYLAHKIPCPLFIHY